MHFVCNNGIRTMSIAQYVKALGLEEQHGAKIYRPLKVYLHNLSEHDPSNETVGHYVFSIDTQKGNSEQTLLKSIHKIIPLKQDYSLKIGKSILNYIIFLYEL
jgi:hypothetical protein